MNVVWKRPDGFHGASPEDFYVAELGGHSRLWLHKKDKDQFPFRIAGGWEEDIASKRLNNLINLLNHPADDWVDYLVKEYGHSQTTAPQAFHTDLIKWVAALTEHLKGDKWEIEIMEQALSMVKQKLEDVQGRFVNSAAT